MRTWPLAAAFCRAAAPGIRMTHLMEFVQDLIERDQVAVRMAMPGLVMRMSKWVDVQLLRALEFVSMLANCQAAAALTPGNGDLLNRIGRRRVAMGHRDLVFESYNSIFDVRDRPSREGAGYVWSLDASLKRFDAMDVSRNQVWGRLRALIHGCLDAATRNDSFAWQAKMPPGAFPPNVFGLGILLGTYRRPWPIGVQRKPATCGAAVAAGVNARLARTIFEMSCICPIVDELPEECIAELAKSRQELRRREAECKIALCGGFEPL